MTSPVSPSGPPTAAPTPPDRGDRATFSARATAAFAHLKDHLIPEMWALVQNAYTNAVAAWDGATAAAGSATTATTQATAAAGSATAAAGSATTATTQATAAAGSATAAAGSATSASSSAAAAAAAAASISGGPVTSVNSKTGIVTLVPSDIGAQPAGSYITGTGSVSGTNTGDETAATIKSKLGISTLSGTNTGDQTLGGLGGEAVTNKATDFATVNHTLYPTVQAVKTYADSLVVGLLDDRGNHNASGNTWPSSGGSGTAGAILKGDLWTISVAGTLGGAAVGVGDVIRALTDAPGTTAANWTITENNLGFVPENSTNKDTSGGYVGLSGWSVKLRNLANSYTSLLQNAATAVRIWAMPDKDGTVALTSDCDATGLGTTISGATAKTTPVDADMLGLSDSAASNVVKKFTWSNLKTNVLSYVVATVNTWTKAQIGSPVALTVSSNAIAVDLSLGNNFSVTLQATTGQTLSNPTNAVAGQAGAITITQNGTPSTLAYGSNWKPIDGTTPSVSTTASAVNVINYYVSSSTVIWYALNKGGVA